MEHQMIIEVTQEDIDTAIARFEAATIAGKHIQICTNCPVAIAFQRYFSDFGSAAWTDGEHIGVIDNGHSRAYVLPEEVSKWVVQFDQAYDENIRIKLQELDREPVPYPPVPFTFEVDDYWVKWMEDLLRFKQTGVTP
jgi:hypothetical protein